MLAWVVVWLGVGVATLVSSHGGGGGSGGRPISTVVTYDTQALKLNDTKWTAGRQWYLDAGALTHNVLPAWSECYRGSRDVTVGVVGDGVYHLSMDIKPNYDKSASYNLVDDNDDARPGSDIESQGTKVASLLGAVANDKCGVGVAFNTSLAGIRYNYQDTVNFDTNLAAALTKRSDKLDVVVGALARGLGKPNFKVRVAISDLINKGRSGKGAVIVWPSGDGATNGSCALDPIVNNPNTISLAAINRQGKPLLTSQSCGALLASAYSEDEGSSDPMISIAADGSCTEEFSGSAASAAFGAGIAALVLQANPNLGWRDVQHVLVTSSNPAVIREPYVINGAGRKVSEVYGFGLLDALAATTTARSWSPVDKARVCYMQPTKLPDGAAYGSAPVTLDQLTLCTGDKQIKYIEHVQLTLTLTDVTSPVSVSVTSPAGTSVTLVRDFKSVSDMTVMSMTFWGETVTSSGTWNVTFSSKTFTGKLTKSQLAVRGTLTEPGKPTSASSGYVTVGDVNVTSNACPVLGPFQTQRSMSTDFTPLYIFIVLVLVVLVGLVAAVVYKKVLKDRIQCSNCGPAFRQVPQNGDTAHMDA